MMMGKEGGEKCAEELVQFVRAKRERDGERC